MREAKFGRCPCLRAGAALLFLLMTAGLTDLPASPVARQAVSGLISLSGGEQKPTLAHRVNLDVEDIPLRSALERLIRAGVPLVYSFDVVDSSATASCDCEGLTVDQVLRHLTARTGIGYRELSTGEIVLFAAPKAAPVRAAMVQGRVTDTATGAGLDGASVRILDTNLATITGRDGTYAISDVPPGAHRIRAERIGYSPVEQEIVVPEAGSLTVDLAMGVTPIAIDPLEVRVSTGQMVATQQKKIGNSIVVIGAAEIQRSGAGSLPEILRGRALGVESLRSGGENASGGHIEIRGVTSFMRDQTPLIYVDGVPVDAGSGGLNRRGLLSADLEENDFAHIRLDEISLDQIERVEIVKGPAATTMYGTDGINGVIQIFTKRGESGRARITARVEQGFQRLRRNDSFLRDSPMADEVADLFNSPRIQKYGLTLSGGAGDVVYSFTGTHDAEEGIVPDNDERQTTLQASLRLVPSEKLSFNINGNLVQRSFKTRSYRELFQFVDVQVAKEQPYYFPFESIEEALELGRRTETDVHRIYGSIAANYQPFPALQASLNVGIDQSFEANERVGFVYQLGLTRDHVERNFRRLSTRFTTSLAYPRTGPVTSTLTAGLEAYRDETERLRMQGAGLSHPSVTDFDQAEQLIGGDIYIPTDLYSAIAQVGGFVQEQIGLGDRFFLTSGVRVDGNSAFGDDFGLQAYPKLSASFVFERGDRWSGKLRAAWGRSGAAPEPFAKDLVFAVARSRETGLPGLRLKDPGNPNLRPEVGTEIEVGIENYFFGNTGSVELNYFRTTTRDAVIRRPLPYSSGFVYGPLANVGELRSQGFEIGARLNAVELGDTDLDLGVTLTRLIENGVVTDVGDIHYLTRYNQTFNWASLEGLREGVSIRDLLFTSVFNDTLHEEFYSGREIISAGSRVPTTYGGVNATLQFLDGFRAYANVVYGLGGHGFDRVQARRDRAAGFHEMASAYVPELARERYIFRSDYVKLDVVRLSYELPAHLVPGAADEAELWIEGRSLANWDVFPRGDPEMIPVTGGFQTVGALDYVIPMPQTYKVGLRVSF